MRLRIISEPQVLFITFRITGECGLGEVVEKIAAAVPNWQSTDGKIKNQLLSERDSQFQMRLTDQGDKCGSADAGRIRRAAKLQDHCGADASARLLGHRRQNARSDDKCRHSERDKNQG
jgi:hypothetical protein